MEVVELMRNGVDIWQSEPGLDFWNGLGERVRTTDTWRGERPVWRRRPHWESGGQSCLWVPHEMFALSTVL
jgi:hypothetical protein